MEEKSEETGKQVFHIEGGVHANRDVIMGDQTNYINVANIHSQAEFVGELQKVQIQIDELKKGRLTSPQARNLAVVEGKVSEAVEEAKKPQPVGGRIKATLTEAKETMELLAGSLAGAVSLGTAIGGLVVAAIKLFGG